MQYIEARCEVENEGVVGAAPTGDAQTTCEWSTILLPAKLRLICGGSLTQDCFTSIGKIV